MLTHAIRRYSQTLAALREFVEIIQPVLEAHKENIIAREAEKVLPLILSPGIDLEELSPEARRQAISLSYDKMNDAFKLRDINSTIKFMTSLQNISLSLGHMDQLYANSLITLVSASENLMAQILHAQFEEFPESAGIQDKTLTFAELNAFKSLDEARAHLIDRTVCQILRNDLAGIVLFFKKQLKLSLEYIVPIYDEILESYQRRHLLIHNGGVVDRIYKDKTQTHIANGFNIGDQITVTEDYLTAAISRFERGFILIAFEVWKKCKPYDQARGENLLRMNFYYLMRGQWDVAEALSLSAVQDKNLTDVVRNIAQIDYWQSIKWQNRFDEVKSHVIDCEFAKNDNWFRLAVMALLDDVDGFFDALPNVVANDGLPKEALAEWPLFRQMRETDAYKTAYGHSA